MAENVPQTEPAPDEPAEENVEAVAGPHLRHGEMQFYRDDQATDHRAKFCIAHKNDENANSILRFMFSDPLGWDMRLPTCFVECARDSAESKRSSEWFEDFMDADKPQPTPHTARKRITQTAPDDWILKTFHTEDPDELPELYETRLVETMKALASTITERRAWVDFGNGSADGLKELMSNAFTDYWSQGDGVVNENKTPVVFAVRMVNEDVLFGDDNEFNEIGAATLDYFDEHRYEAHKGALCHQPITKRVAYRFKSKPKEEQTWDLKVDKTYVADIVTHVVYVHSFNVRDDLQAKLKRLGQRVSLVANGGRDGAQSLYRKIISNAKFGAVYIVFDNTGGAAQRVANDLWKQKNGSQDELASVTAPSQFKVIDPLMPLDDACRTLQNVLFSIQENEGYGAGYLAAEKKRLTNAWEQYAIFNLSEKRYLRLARIFQGSIVFLLFLTTVVSVFYCRCQDRRDTFVLKMMKTWSDEEGTRMDQFCGVADWNSGIVTKESIIHDQIIQFAAKLIIWCPLLLSFILTQRNKLKPMNKWAHLKSGAVSMISEIYYYRTRCERYSKIPACEPQIGDVIEELLKPPAGEGESKRHMFAHECQRILDDSLGTELMFDYLENPSPEKKKEAFNLFDSTAHEPKPTRCQRICGKRTSGESRRIKVDSTDVDLWETAGHDFKFHLATLDEHLKDDGWSVLNAEQYINVRMFPMLQQLHSRAKVVGRVTRNMQVVITVLTAMTTLVAAFQQVDLRKCVPVAVATVAVFTQILQFEKFESRLYNIQRSIQKLKELQIWWYSLSASERRKNSTKEFLVSHTEEQADCEIAPWKKADKSQPQTESEPPTDEQKKKEEKKKEQ